MSQPARKSDAKNATPYVSVLVTLTLLTMSVFVIISALRPGQDNLTLILAAIATSTPLVIGISLLIKVNQDASRTVEINYEGIAELRRAVSELRREVDGRLTELLTLTATASKAEGVKESEDRSHTVASALVPAPSVANDASVVSVAPSPSAHPPAPTVAVAQVETLIVTDAKIEGTVQRVVTPPT